MDTKRCLQVGRCPDHQVPPAHPAPGRHTTPQSARIHYFSHRYVLKQIRRQIFTFTRRPTLVLSLPLQDKVHKLWPMSCERCESAPGSSRWRSRCSEPGATSCCRCTEGSRYKASSPARPPTTPLPTSTFASGHHYSVDNSGRISEDNYTPCGLVQKLSFPVNHQLV